jgi:hypothetical protein
MNTDFATLQMTVVMGPRLRGDDDGTATRFAGRTSSQNGCVITAPA